MTVALLACAVSIAAGGCGRTSVHAAAPASAPVPKDAGRPMNTAPDTDAAPPVETVEAPPTLPAVSEPPPPPVAIPAPRPATPRKLAGDQPGAEADSEPAAHPPAPQISPRLSPGDQASYERKTNDDIYVAEKNLAQINGKQLSAAQQDLFDKIHSFLSQSRDASKDGDWARAQNLAQKARLLSAELINSL
ncbi:MAG TPA: hypothetical protein VJO53_03625 [Candidatus Acidoferrales bacterium]|nr:hypothetical protein [Candidatus Acidoferrales bacterium]